MRRTDSTAAEPTVGQRCMPANHRAHEVRIT